MNPQRSRSRHIDRRKPDEKAAWKAIRDRIKKNRQDPALQKWASNGGDLKDCPSLWLIDNTYLMNELQRIRDLVQRVPLVSVAISLPLQSVSDAISRLERDLRDILHIHRDGQRAFAKKVDATQKRSAKESNRTDTKVIRLRANG
jgi:hypothetical protein